MHIVQRGMRTRARTKQFRSWISVGFQLLARERIFLSSTSTSQIPHLLRNSVPLFKVCKSCVHLWSCTDLFQHCWMLVWFHTKAKHLTPPPHSPPPPQTNIKVVGKEMKEWKMPLFWMYCHFALHRRVTDLACSYSVKSFGDIMVQVRIFRSKLCHLLKEQKINCT